MKKSAKPQPEKKKAPSPVPLKGPWRHVHGRHGEESWARPVRVVECDQEARPGYNSRKAHEYEEDPATLQAKIRKLAEMIRSSKHCVAYTGAGLSTSAGISDYATKAKSQGSPVKKRGLDATPAYGHRALVSLFNAGYLKHWVQQNHDGLPQKAGFPQQHINEIHGAWFDPSNPVVPMSGSLRGDLCEWMEEEEEKADLTLALGTSLCGMNADRMVETPSAKAALPGSSCLGSVIVSIQQTVYDDQCSLRIFSRLDHVLQLLMDELGLEAAPVPDPKDNPLYGLDILQNLPYDSNGKLNPDAKLTLRLCKGSRVKLTAGPGRGYVGSVVGRSNAGNIVLELPMTREGHPDQGKVLKRYQLGLWVLNAALDGKLPILPIVNPAAASR
jgi:NAD-dependent SIR2 family protein deacetylase